MKKSFMDLSNERKSEKQTKGVMIMIIEAVLVEEGIKLYETTWCRGQLML